MPSHSTQDTFGLSEPVFGSIFTTEDSTWGGGLKFFLQRCQPLADIVKY